MIVNATGGLAAILASKAIVRCKRAIVLPKPSNNYPVVYLQGLLEGRKLAILVQVVSRTPRQKIGQYCHNAVSWSALLWQLCELHGAANGVRQYDWPLHNQKLLHSSKRVQLRCRYILRSDTSNREAAFPSTMDAIVQNEVGYHCEESAQHDLETKCVVHSGQPGLLFRSEKKQGRQLLDRRFNRSTATTLRNIASRGCKQLGVIPCLGKIGAPGKKDGVIEWYRYHGLCWQRKPSLYRRSRQNDKDCKGRCDSSLGQGWDP